MFDRFNDQARRVVVHAQDEARMLNHHYIGTEHILMALTRDGDTKATQVLTAQKVYRYDVWALILSIVGKGSSEHNGHIPFTPLAKTSLELAMREAISFGHNHISAEHLLLALVRQTEGVAVEVLTTFGATDAIRDSLVSGFSAKPTDPDPTPPSGLTPAA
jgi:ATP-dependent Clp protease ATP-binding subunit ClpC